MTIRSYHQKSSERLNFNNTVPDPAPPASAPFRLCPLPALLSVSGAGPFRCGLRPSARLSTPPPRYSMLSVVANYGHSTRRKPISLHR